MKKNKIAVKLGLNFAAALLVFSLAIGSIFVYLFKTYTMDMHKKDILHYAQTLSKTISQEEDLAYGDRRNGMMGMMGRGMMAYITDYEAYVSFIVDALDADVWIVDKDLNMVSSEKGHHMARGMYNIAELPENARDLIQNILQGESAFSETLNQRMLTVGVPIVDKDDSISGAVFIHSKIDGIDAGINKGLGILGISIFLALLITSVLSILMSYSFVKPLNKMKNVALRLAGGDYAAQSNIDQNDEIGELADTIDLLGRRLDEASKESAKLELLRRDFVANISHELRTPITVIKGSLEALADKVVTDPRKIEEFHIQMLGETKFLERLVGDLLDLSRLQNTDFAIEISDLNICEVISDVSRSASHLAKEKNVKIQTIIPEKCPPIRGDYGRIRQMLLIILDNAVKFSPWESQVQIEIKEDRICIRDYGPGIEKNQLPHIFERFYKTQGESNKEGTGLGLAIAKQIAERHHMSLRAENCSDGGARFTIFLAENPKI